MSKTDELKKLSEKLVGSAPDTRKASSVVEYIADQMSGDSENTDTISQSIAYLTKHVQGGGGGRDSELSNLLIVFDLTQITPVQTQEGVEYSISEIVPYPTLGWDDLNKSITNVSLKTLLALYYIVEGETDNKNGYNLFYFKDVDGIIKPLILDNFSDLVSSDANGSIYSGGVRSAGEYTNVGLEHGAAFIWKQLTLPDNQAKMEFSLIFW